MRIFERDIGDWAFGGCGYLAFVYFQGNAPAVGLDAFKDDTGATVVGGKVLGARFCYPQRASEAEARRQADRSSPGRMLRPGDRPRRRSSWPRRTQPTRRRDSRRTCLS